MLFVTLLQRYIAVFALNKALACLWLVLFVAFDCELITRPLSHDPEQPVPPSLPPPSPCWNSVQPLSHCWNPIVSWGCFSSGITRELPIPIHSCRSLTLISINLTLYLSDTALSSALLREKLTKRSPSISTFLCGSRGAAFSGLFGPT